MELVDDKNSRGVEEKRGFLWNLVDQGPPVNLPKFAPPIPCHCHISSRKFHTYLSAILPCDST